MPNKTVEEINAAADMIGTVVPAIGALASVVRLIATAVKPTVAQQAQAFDAAIADLDAATAGLGTSIAAFEDAKATAAANAAAKASS